MKAILFAVLFSVTGTLSVAQELAPVFGPFVNVTPTSANGSTRPRIALVNDSVPLISWAKTGTSGSVFVSKWNGTSFSAATQVSPVGLPVYCSAEEGGDMVAQGDTAYIVFFTTDSRSYCIHSYDAGITWSDTVRINHIPLRDAYTPDVQMDLNRNPVVVFESSDLNMANTAQMVCRSNDGGQSFQMEQPAHTNVNGAPCECCPPSLLVKDSMTYVVYRNNLSNIRDIVFTISSDSGATFPVVCEIDQMNWNLTSCPTAGAEATFYRDSILVLWKSGNKLYFGCGEHQTGVAGPNSLLEPALPASVIQRHPFVTSIGDTIVYLWDDRRTTNTECYISIIGDGARPVTLPTVVNDTIGTAENGTQQTPHAVYDGTRLHIVYQNLATGIVMYRTAEIGGTDVGITETENSLSPVLYPVPASSTVSFQNINTGFAVTIYNIYGQIVFEQQNLSAGQPVSVDSLPAGVYTVMITSVAGNKTSLPLIKQ